MFKPEDTRAATYQLPAALRPPETGATTPTDGYTLPATLRPPEQPSTSFRPEAEESDLEAFKKTVSRYIATERKIADLAKQLKSLRTENADIKADICKFMGERDIEDLRTREMRLKLKTANYKPPLKKAELHERVAEYLGGEDKAAEFFEKVYNDRDSVQKTSLCRLKVPKSLAV